MKKGKIPTKTGKNPYFLKFCTLIPLRCRKSVFVRINPYVWQHWSHVAPYTFSKFGLARSSGGKTSGRVFLAEPPEEPPPPELRSASLTVSAVRSRNTAYIRRKMDPFAKTSARVDEVAGEVPEKYYIWTRRTERASFDVAKPG